MRQQITSAISAILQISRLTDGSRKLVSLQEVVGMEGDVITMQEIYGFTQTGVADDGTVEGYFAATGVRPQFMRRIKAFGIGLGDETFDPHNSFT
jgi:pilus assembly protein CpaF